MPLDVEAVHWLLAHLYDNAALAECQLINEFHIQDNNPISRSKYIRSIILDCIEFLRPARHEPLRSLAARNYAVLWLRYVEGMNINQVSEELALGERQTYRELRSAESALTNAVNNHLSTIVNNIEATTTPPDELAVSVKLAPVELGPIFISAIKTLQPLAQTIGVNLINNIEQIHGKAFTDAGVLHQLIAQILSLAVQNSKGHEILVSATNNQTGQVIFSVQFPIIGVDLIKESINTVQQLADTLELSFYHHQETERFLNIELTIPLREPRNIMVIEDNNVAIELYRRYLEPSGDWRIVPVPEPRFAYDMARSLQPALIILDLLMPGTDGYTILNMLHAHEDTAGIPVIVCSVFQDPLLAQSLGAKAHLRKPVSQLQLLSAVKQWAL